MSATQSFFNLLGGKMDLAEYLVIIFVTAIIIALGLDLYWRAFGKEKDEE